MHKDNLWCVDSYILPKNATAPDDSSRNWQVSLSTSNIRWSKRFSVVEYSVTEISTRDIPYKLLMFTQLDYY